MNLHVYSLPVFTSKKMFAALFVLLSLLIAAYAPMTTITSAQTVADGKLQDLKQKAISVLEQRISSYQKTLESLKVDVSVDKTGSTSTTSSDKGTSTTTVNKDGVTSTSTATNGAASSYTLGKDGLTGTIALPDDLEGKVQQFLEKIISSLTGLKDKVMSASSLGSMQSLTQNIDQQFKLDQLTQVQATVTQAIESMTGVLDGLKTTFNDLQSQVGQLKDCVTKVFEGGSVNTSTTTSSAGVSCSEFNLTSADVATQAQSQLDSMTNVITTISSIISSSVALLMSLVGSFSGLAGGLGGLGSLGNLGNLGNLTDLGSLTSSLGSVGGLMSSFTAITSQLDIANFMSGNALGGLTNLTSLINIPGGLGI